MGQEEFNKIFACNLRRLMSEHDKNQTDIVNYMGVSKSTVSDWCKGSKAPRMDKMDKLCALFGVTRSELMDEKQTDLTNKNRSNLTEEHYYIDSETREYANELKNNKELRMLFDASRNAKKEDLEIVYNMLLALKKREQGED